MIHEVAIMRFLEANDRFHRAEFSCEQAAEYMGVSVSTFYRRVLTKIYIYGRILPSEKKEMGKCRDAKNAVLGRW
jgi:hypothetical protein